MQLVLTIWQNGCSFFPAVQLDLCVCAWVGGCLCVWFLTARLYLWVSSQCWMGNCAFSVCPLLCGKSCYLRLYWNTDGIDLDLRLIAAIVVGYWLLSMIKWNQIRCISLTKWGSAAGICLNDRLVSFLQFLFVFLFFFFSSCEISIYYVLETHSRELILF